MAKTRTRSRTSRQQRSLEAFETPISWRELIAALGAGPTDAGVDITAHNMLQISSVWCAVRIISEAMGVLPLVLFERVGDHAAKRAIGHPVYRLLHRQPNPVMTPAMLKEVLQAHVLTWGNGYAKIIFDGSGRPAELWPLPPSQTKPVLAAGKLMYQTRDHDGGCKYLFPEEVLHIPGLGFDGYVGYSVVHMARQALGVAKARERYAAKFYSNGANPGGVLQHPGALSDKSLKRLRESLAQTHGGVDNAWRPMILEEGLKWESTGMSPRDSQFIEGQKFSVVEIARIFRVPPHMLYEFGGATYSNIEHLSLEFVKYSLSIWLTKWEEHLLLRLLGEDEQDKFFFGFLTSAFERADRATRFNSYKIGREGGWLSVNDIRAEENMNPVEGGDIYLQPLNMTKAGEEPDGDDGKNSQGGPKKPDMHAPPKEPDDDDGGDGRSLDVNRIVKAHMRTLTDAAERWIRREGNAAKRATVKGGGLEGLRAWVEEFGPEHRKFIQEACRPAVESLAEILAVRAGAADQVNEVIDAAYVRLATLAEEQVAGLRQQVLSADTPADQASRERFPGGVPGVGQHFAESIAAAVQVKLQEISHVQA